jgi:hypothetical protein
MDTDRRLLSTGPAAVAVAGFATSLSASVAPLVRVGRAFSKDDPELSAYFSESFACASYWQCHVHHSAERIFRHCASGLIFATASRDPAAVWLVRPAEAAIVPPYTPELFRIAYAARYIRITASVVDHLQRHSGDGRRRPFFLYPKKRRVDLRGCATLTPR